jgi:hypothetical protein
MRIDGEVYGPVRTVVPPIPIYGPKQTLAPMVGCRKDRPLRGTFTTCLSTWLRVVHALPRGRGKTAPAALATRPTCSDRIEFSFLNGNYNGAGKLTVYLRDVGYPKSFNHAQRVCFAS